MEKKDTATEANTSVAENVYGAQVYDPPHVPDTSTMRNYQLECLDAIEKAGSGSHLIVMATGLGKCFAPGTRIQMYDHSIKKVEDIKENDFVMGSDHKARKVTGLTHGRDTMYTVHQSNGNDYTVNSVHILSLVPMSPVYINGILYYEKSVVNIEIGDYLKLSSEKRDCLKGWKIKDHETIYSDIQITQIGEGEYYGFELIGPDRLFLLEDGTVVHNTYVFSHIPRKGRVLLLSHRDELVHQPEKYYDCSFGVEQASEKSNGEEIVSASVQSMSRRLDKFAPDAFDVIITDEAHHATAKSYQKIYNYFKPRVHLGFTATPNRGDKDDLHKIYDDIIYFKDIRWGIKNGFLCDVDCIRVDVGYDLSHARKVMGDFSQTDIDNALSKPEVVDAVAEAYHKFAKGQTLIFAANVKHANAIAEKIDGAVVVTGDTLNRAEIIQKFTNREIPCIVNCMVFTEGTDIPLIETVIMARPTANQSLYCQAVGRGLRLYPGKERLTLVDCVGASRLSLCSAPTLFGLNSDVVPKERRNMIQGELSKMDSIINIAIDTPASWIENAERVSVFGEENDLELNHVNWTLMPDESMHCNIGNGINIVVPAADALGQTEPYMQKRVDGEDVVIGKMRTEDIQTALNEIYTYLVSHHESTRSLWDLSVIKNGWGQDKITKSQISYIKNLMKKCGRKFDKSIYEINKRQAGIIIDHLLYEINNATEKTEKTV